MNAGIFDLLEGLRARLDSSDPFLVVSAYRSPVTNARMNCLPGMSVRDTSQLMGAATTQQIAAEVVAMIAVVSSGSRKS